MNDGKSKREIKIEKEGFPRLLSIVKQLRNPEGGCPWDLEQSPESLSSDFIEEVYEALEAIRDKDDEHLKEELGDVFLLVTMISYMKEQEGAFLVKDVLMGISEKLIRRHPHVFSDKKAGNPEEVLEQWNAIKVNVEGRAPKDSLLDKVSKGLPPLERAYKLQKKASKAGFDWPDVQGAWEKVHEEIQEVQCADSGNKEEMTDELGDLLFSVVNISRHMGVDPAEALHNCNRKFMKRFAHMEKRMKAQGLEMCRDNLEVMDQFWEESKEK